MRSAPKTVSRTLWLNAYLPMLVRPRVLWALQALPLAGLLLSFVPWFLWLVPWAESRHPSLYPLTGQLVLLLLLFLALMLAGIVGGMWLGWRLNEQVCLHLLGWDAAEVQRVFRASQLPSRWLKPGVASTDGLAETDRAAQAQRQDGVLRYVFKVGVLRWGLTMFLAVGLAPRLLRGEALSVQTLAVQALIWLLAGLAFGLILWWLEGVRLRSRARTGSS